MLNLKKSKKYWIVLVCILLLSCKNYRSNHSWSGYESIGHKPYEIYIPDGYMLKELQGYDSYVGEIFNEAITFSFDYGLYGSGSAPMSIQSLEKQIRSGYPEAMASACFEGAVSAKRLRKQIKILNVICQSRYRNQ